MTKSLSSRNWQTTTSVSTLSTTRPKVSLHLSVGRYKKLTVDFEEEIKKVTDGVDHVIEFIGKSYWTQNLNVLRRDGVMVYLAFMSGAGFPEDASIAQVRRPSSLYPATLA